MQAQISRFKDVFEDLGHREMAEMGVLPFRPFLASRRKENTTL